MRCMAVLGVAERRCTGEQSGCMGVGLSEGAHERTQPLAPSHHPSLPHHASQASWSRRSSGGVTCGWGHSGWTRWDQVVTQ